MKNKNALFYILGMVSSIAIIPILEELTTVILSWVEYLKLKPNKLVLQGNKEIQELQAETEEVNTCAIGFHYNPDSDDMEDSLD